LCCFYKILGFLCVSKKLVLLGHYKNGAGEDIPSNEARGFIKDFIESNTDYNADVFGWYNSKNRDQNESECVSEISVAKSVKAEALENLITIHKENWSSDVRGVPGDVEYIRAVSLGSTNPFSITTNPDSSRMVFSSIYTAEAGDLVTNLYRMGFQQGWLILWDVQIQLLSLLTTGAILKLQLKERLTGKMLWIYSAVLF